MPTNFKEPHAQLDNMEIHSEKFQIILMETTGGAHTKNCLKKVWTDRQMDRRRGQNLDKAACYNYIKLWPKPFVKIYYSKFAKDHFFLVKYFCILRKLHKYFCVS